MDRREALQQGRTESSLYVLAYEYDSRAMRWWLEEIGMDHVEPIRWLVRTRTQV